MINRSINMSFTVHSENTENKREIAHLNCQIGANVDSLHLSIIMLDRDLYEQNKEFVGEQCKKFIEEAFSEAINTGWEFLK